jgi:hypothetical protein
MSALVTVELDFLQGLTTYLAQQKADRGRSEAATLQRLMKYWVSYAMADVPRADAAAIRLYLLGKTALTGPAPARTRRKRSAQRQRLQQTIAMAIVIKTNYKGEEGRKASDINGIALLNLVNKYINARAFSAGLHRAGFLPALQLLRAPAGERLPKYKHIPGSVAIIDEPETFGITVENFAKIIATLAPNAFQKATRNLETNLLQWTRENQTTGLRTAGLDAA